LTLILIEIGFDLDY